MLASIDIGTNTVRCLITSRSSSLINPEFVDMKVIRLGENFKKQNIITAASIGRLVEALKVYSGKFRQYGISPDSVVITGTSVLRDAPNSPEIKNILKKEFGLNLEIISGDKEAEITLKGISSCFDGLSDFYSIDIGGGSTEYTCVRNGITAWKHSIEMGVVHLTEETVHSDPVSRGDLSALEKKIDDKLDLLKRFIKTENLLKDGPRLFGTAGTSTTLAMVDMGINSYDRQRVHGYFLKKESVAEIYKKFIGSAASGRLKIAGVQEGREDLVLAGTAIMLKSMDFFAVNGFTASECGLLEGLIAG